MREHFIWLISFYSSLCWIWTIINWIITATTTIITSLSHFFSYFLKGNPKNTFEIWIAPWNFRWKRMYGFCEKQVKGLNLTNNIVWLSVLWLKAKCEQKCKKINLRNECRIDTMKKTSFKSDSLYFTCFSLSSFLVVFLEENPSILSSHNRKHEKSF